jgi:SAM-dependent methyltransferase
VDDIPAPADLEAIYGAAFFDVGEKFGDAPVSAGRTNAHERVERLLALPGIGRHRWLDVGCATGDFLPDAAAAVEQIAGVEISQFAAARVRDSGFDVTAGDFLDVALAPDTIDVITMWDYIEHVPAPALHLRKAFDALRPGGYLALSTGDVTSLVARSMGRFWHLMIPPRHLYFFSPDALRRLLAASGFELVRIGRPGKRVPIDFVAWKLAIMTVPRLAPTALRWCGALGLGRVSPRLNLGDILTLYARKPASTVRADREPSIAQSRG